MSSLRQPFVSGVVDSSRLADRQTHAVSLMHLAEAYKFLRVCLGFQTPYWDRLSLSPDPHFKTFDLDFGSKH